jgi:SAM-dependent methyltransferase
LPAKDVDVVTVAQAWHWVDVERAVPEVARVLRPGGTLGLVWNVRDETVDWVAELGRLMHPGSEHDMFSDAPPVGPPFRPIERRDFAWTHVVDRATVLDLVASRSYFIVLGQAERDEMLRNVRALLDTHPALAGRSEIAMPYITRCSRTSLR